LNRLGGIYIDADSSCRRPLDAAPFLGSGFFAVHEPTPLAENLISNAFMGARSGHPVLQRYIAALASVADPRPQWRRTGPLALTDAVRSGDENDVQILPAWTFMRQTVRREPVTGGKPYGEHFFSSTAERVRGARPYPD
jgi:mannosyltransferase OCH1-like enzyme